MDKEIRDLDLVILGGGPAGLAAAIYASRAKLNMILLETAILGGQVRNSFTIENYPGFKTIQGSDLADRMQEQAEESGAIIDEFDPVINVILEENNNTVETEQYIYRPKTVIISTGATPKKLPLSNEAKYAGRGIHYCAVCDGVMYEGKIVGVVGGGNSALEEALFLTKFADKVYIIRRHDYFNGESSMIEEVKSNSKIEVLYNQDLVSVGGGEFIEEVVIKSTISGEEKSIKMDALFGYIGTEPKTKSFDKYIDLTSRGYIITDEKMRTNISGVFAAGDVRDKDYRQITTAVADGTIAALEVEKHIKQTNN
jgi:thioredoxin reductase (NADPH)